MIGRVTILWTQGPRCFKQLSLALPEGFKPSTSVPACRAWCSTLELWKRRNKYHMMGTKTMARKRAAPPLKEASETKKPWEAAGVSKATYYRKLKSHPVSKSHEVSLAPETGETAFTKAPEKRVVIGRPIQKGEVLNPAGRPKGSRNKLTQDFVAAMCEDFRLNGAAVVEKVRSEKPDVYLRVIASLVPAQVEVGEAGAFADLEEAELDAVIDKMGEQLAMLTRDDDERRAVH